MDLAYYPKTIQLVWYAYELYKKMNSFCEGRISLRLYFH